MLKIGQNWGKIANYPPNAHQRSAPLPADFQHKTIQRTKIVHTLQHQTKKKRMNEFQLRFNVQRVKTKKKVIT